MKRGHNFSKMHKALHICLFKQQILNSNILRRYLPMLPKRVILQIDNEIFFLFRHFHQLALLPTLKSLSIL